MTDRPGQTRQTRQQRAIREAFLVADRPLSPQEVLVASEKAVPGLGIATVYRHLRALLDKGWLVAVNVPGEPARYELSGKRHHHHFHCRACGKVYDIPGCTGRLPDGAPKGFRVDDHEVVLYGRCPECIG